MLKLAFLGLHNGVLLSHNVISIVNQAFLFQFVLFIHLHLHLPLLYLLHQVLLQRIVLILALERFTLQVVADFEILSLLGFRAHRCDKFVLFHLGLCVALQTTCSVLACDGVLPCDVIFHPLHVIVLILHEWGHACVQVFDHFVAIFEVLNR